ncbi:CRISPR-associated endonuclease Cas2 [Limnohabitans sp.]|jgi:CRISPR-associated protein Cas2|uniref:CRISPR-associated endonuclease Cas2 n=1 Tax=Limnohabitans sp. TaxID=1907725 RepID=UPI0037BF1FED
MTKPSTRSLPIPHSHAQRWLLAHDIRDKKRLQKVWRYLRQEGVRLQYSVYLLAGTRHQVEAILERLRELIDESADDVRIYPLTENTRIWGLGTQFNEGGNTLCDAFVDKLKQADIGTPDTLEDKDPRLNIS